MGTNIPTAVRTPLAKFKAAGSIWKTSCMMFFIGYSILAIHC